MSFFREPHPKKFDPRGQSDIRDPPLPLLEMAPSVGVWEFFGKMSYRGKMDSEKFRAHSSLFKKTICEKYEEICGKYGGIYGDMKELYRKYEEICGKYKEICGKYDEICGRYEEICGRYDFHSLACPRHSLIFPSYLSFIFLHIYSYFPHIPTCIFFKYFPRIHCKQKEKKKVIILLSFVAYTQGEISDFFQVLGHLESIMSMIIKVRLQGLSLRDRMFKNWDSREFNATRVKLMMGWCSISILGQFTYC